MIAATLTNCSSTTEFTPPCADPDGGIFVGNVSGAESGAIQGCASYAVTQSGGTSTVMVITVGPESSPRFQLSLVRSGGQPTPGSYDIGPNPGNFTGAILANPGGRTFGLTLGNVIIDAAVVRSMQGSLNVTGAQAGTGTIMTISGTFSAVCTPQGAVTC